MFDQIKNALERSSRRSLIVAALCVFAALMAYYGVGWDGWVKTWFGVMFKAASGATAGLLWSRYIARIDLSSFEPKERHGPGLSVAIYVVGGALAVACGA